MGEAAKRDVGNGANQIPDMSYFATGSGGGIRYTRLPDGTIIQRGQINVYGGGSTITLPQAMPSSSYVVLATDVDANAGSGSCLAGSALTTSTFQLHGLTWSGGVLSDSNPGSIYFMAISL